MKNKELQKLLKNYDENMEVRLRVEGNSVVIFSEENIMHTSETAYINDDVPESEDVKIELGNGGQYLLLNPIVV